ncbi:MAG: hypothetical protein K6T68_12345 [Alicyclobacillus shizuokensis]|nr:hypothetical protein [Alicyclobacillus shizuokensis]
MQRGFRVQTTILLGACLCLLGAGGCGAPDLTTMRPSVTKQAAIVYLVGHRLPHWSESQVLALQSSTGLVIAATSLTDRGQVLSRARELVRRTADRPPLLVVVAEQPPSADFVSFLRRHQDLKVEWICRKAASVQLDNLRQVVDNQRLAAYAAGWLAGSIAMQRSSHSLATVGWYVTGSEPSAPLGHAFLAGLYNGNTTARVVALPADSSTELPGVVVVWGEVPAKLRQQALLSGSLLVTPLGQTPSADSVVLTLPPVSALTADLRAYKENKWRPGVQQADTAPQIDVDPSVVPADMVTDLQQVQTTLAAQPTVPEKQWQAISAEVKQKWQSDLDIPSA